MEQGSSDRLGKLVKDSFSGPGRSQKRGRTCQEKGESVAKNGGMKQARGLVGGRGN